MAGLLQLTRDDGEFWRVMAESAAAATTGAADSEPLYVRSSEAAVVRKRVPQPVVQAVAVGGEVDARANREITMVFRLVEELICPGGYIAFEDIVGRAASGGVNPSAVRGEAPA